APERLRGVVSPSRPASTPRRALWSPWRSTPPSSSAGAVGRSAKSACFSAAASRWWRWIAPAEPPSWSAAINWDGCACCSRTARRKPSGWCWRRFATSTPKRRWTSRNKRLCSRRAFPRRRKRPFRGEVFCDLLLRLSPKENPAGIAQPGRRPDPLFAHHLRHLRPAAHRVRRLAVPDKAGEGQRHAQPLRLGADLIADVDAVGELAAENGEPPARHVGLDGVLARELGPVARAVAGAGDDQRPDPATLGDDVAIAARPRQPQAPGEVVEHEAPVVGRNLDVRAFRAGGGRAGSG